jgi:hypothetical protein
MRFGNMQEWTSDTLWSKAKAFSEQALQVDPRGPLFPLLASFALETLGKAALSKIHPVLIADPRGEGQHILYAFGVPTKEPRTIMAKTVFSRLASLVEKFTEDHAKACLVMAERRNRELHTGEFAYDEHSTGSWLPDYYRISAILTDFLGRDLEDFLGKAGAAEATETNYREDERIKSEVLKRIAECAKGVKHLKAAELQTRRETYELKRHWSFIGNTLWLKSHACPACSSKGALTVKHIGDRPAEIVDASIFVESIYSPRKFECGVCDLKLSGTPELRLANLADQILDSSEHDPAEFFEIDTSGAMHDDYGND